MNWKTKLLQNITQKGAQLQMVGDQLQHAGKAIAGKAIAANSVQQGAKIARNAAASLPVKELATMCGRAGVAGAIVDGAMGGAQAARALAKGKITKKQAAAHVANEAGCGFVTSSAGTAGTMAAYMVTGTMGPVTLVAGMGASMGSRYIYRKVVGETMPGQKTQTKDHDDTFENIGPQED